MKWTAICINVIALATGLYLVVTEPWHSPGPEEIFVVFLVFAAPISSLAALFLKDRENWLALYLKRKALEEKQKIEKLRGQESRDRPKP